MGYQVGFSSLRSMKTEDTIQIMQLPGHFSSPLSAKEGTRRVIGFFSPHYDFVPTAFSKFTRITRSVHVFIKHLQRIRGKVPAWLTLIRRSMGFPGQGKDHSVILYRGEFTDRPVDHFRSHGSGWTFDPTGSGWSEKQVV